MKRIANNIETGILNVLEYLLVNSRNPLALFHCSAPLHLKTVTSLVQ